MADLFSARLVVWIDVRGDRLCEKFMNWMQEPAQRLLLPEEFVACGPWFYKAAFAPDDAAKVVTWLRSQKAKDVTPARSRST